MKTQADLVKPPTLDTAIRKYLRRVASGGLPYPDNVQAVGQYVLEGQDITVYRHHGKLVFDAGRLDHAGLSINVRNILGKLEKYLQRTEHLSYDEHIILKYTKYWG